MIRKAKEKLIWREIAPEISLLFVLGTTVFLRVVENLLGSGFGIKILDVGVHFGIAMVPSMTWRHWKVLYIHSG
jgi:hypothetical protein